MDSRNALVQIQQGHESQLANVRVPESHLRFLWEVASKL